MISSLPPDVSFKKIFTKQYFLQGDKSGLEGGTVIRKDMIRLKTEVFVKAWLRRCLAAGAFAAIVHKGNTEAGIVIVKIVTGDGRAKAYMETFSDSSEIGWRSLSEEFDTEDAIDTLINKETRFDPDLWIVEVQDAEGRSFLDGTD